MSRWHPLVGDSFAINTAQAHTLLVNLFVAGNDTAEVKIQGLQRVNDGREAYRRPVEHYEGVGIHAIDIREAHEVIKNLFMAYVTSEPPANTAANNECDSNADTCCLGKNFVELQAIYRTADVYAYDALIQPVENVPILSGATAYNDPISGDTYILVFQKALSYGTKLDHSLINPNQVRVYGIPFWDNPNDPDRGLSIDVKDSLHIPLQPVGTKLQFRTPVPVTQELQDCEHISISSPYAWNPTKIVTVQQMNQGGRISWKRLVTSIGSVESYQSYKYLDAESDEALLDPPLVHVGQWIKEDCRH
ncbi:hypothetical protein MHU86_6977 [Fragilaria crotonensis]|nr:hypothetical protein MHU86_6977 [Fragilaria crotonensis]